MKLKKRKPQKLREFFLTTVLFGRLTMGEVLNPVLFPVFFRKFFPTPRKAVYRKNLANYFFEN